MFSRSFEIAFERTVDLEGGYINDPDDRGGETKFGISKKAFPDLDIANLTINQAKQIYHSRYWMPLDLDFVKNMRVAEEVFDTAVNMGTVMAAQIVQRTLNFLGARLKEDGIIGPVTMGSLNCWIDKDAIALFKALNGFQFMRYADIVERDSSQKKFSRGWMKRIDEYREAK